MIEVSTWPRATEVTPAPAKAGWRLHHRVAQIVDAGQVMVVLPSDLLVDTGVDIFHAPEAGGLPRAEVADHEHPGLRILLITLPDCLA